VGGTERARSDLSFSSINGVTALSASKRYLLVASLLLVAALCACFLKYRADVAAWDQVQNSLVRLHSGFQYESVIALRSHLADTDAALRLYRTGWRIYPPGRAERVHDAEQSLAYISSAVDWQTRSNGDTLDQADIRTLEKYPEVTAYLVRSCAAGRVHVSSANASTAFAIVGMSLLERSEYPATSESKLSLNQFGPLHYESETAECQRQENVRVENEQHQEAARRENESKKYWAQFRYRVSLKLLPSTPGTCVFDLRTDGKFVDTSELYPGRAQDFGANHDALIYRATCYGATVPADVIKITVNGNPYTPKWEGQNAKITPDKQ
jgi:hypothetical protein